MSPSLQPHRVMKIGELAQATDTPVETIPFYEREGLMPPSPRSEGNYRLYGPTHIERLAFLRQCRGLDMALDEVRVLLRFKDSPHADCGDVNAPIDDHIGHVSSRIAELRALEKELKALRKQCAEVQGASNCGILKNLSSPGAKTVAEGRGKHVARSHR